MGALDRVADAIVHGARESFLRTLTTRLVGALRSLVLGTGTEARAANALDMASARVAEQAMGTWAEFRPRVAAETAREVGRALRDSDEALSRRLAEDTGADRPWGLTNRARNDLAEATRGVREVVGRDNVARLAASVQAMQGATDAHVAARAWYEVAGAAITRVDMGDDPDEVMRDAVAELARRGVETVDYRSGARTTVDAAVRRHVDSQLSQAANDMAIRQCEEWGVGLVMVDAHWGARPSHAAWQGKVYSLHGEVTVDGVTYPDLYEATGYQGRNGWPLGAQLAGVNCRHRITPYIPGISRIQSDDFDAMAKKYGMTSDEYYRQTQRQRSLERALRAAKREAAFLEDEGLDATAQRYRIGDLQRRLRELCRATGLERDPTRERAYGVTHQPRGLNSQSKAALAERAQQEKWRAFPQSKDTMSQTHGIRRLGRKEINALQRRSDEAFSDMTVEQLDAIKGYTTGDHNIINQRLYGLRRQTTKIRTRADAAITQIDNAIPKFTLEQDVVVFSGTDAKHYTNWEPGSTHSLKGYLSTSVRYKDAAEFCSREAGQGNEPLMITVRVPSGTSCLFVGDNTFFPEYQGEMIMAHGLKYKVIGRAEGRMLVEVVQDVNQSQLLPTEEGPHRGGPDATAT